MAAYGCLLLVLLPLQSLWLDELMEVMATRTQPVLEVVRGYAAHSAGQSPLGAIEQTLSIRLLGFSNFAARLPAALAAMLAVAGMLLLARVAGLTSQWLAAVLLASFPLMLRYGTEARPYSAAVCVAVWMTVLLLKYRQTGRWRDLLLYGILLMAGMYTQPYLVFAAIAQACYLFPRERRRAWAVTSAILLAGALYLPWYFYARGFWREEVSVEGLHFHPQAKLPLLVVRELLGLGYAGTMLVIALAFYAWRGRSPAAPVRDSFWILAAVLPVLMVILADWWFDYFFAIRQVIFVLPAFAVLAAEGVGRIGMEAGRKAAVAVMLLLLALDAGYALRWFTKPREDWKAAADLLAKGSGASSCVVALPADSSKYYEFFRPDLRNRLCAAGLASGHNTVQVAASPYLRDHSVAETEAMLRAQHFREAGSALPAGPRIVTYVRAETK